VTLVRELGDDRLELLHIDLRRACHLRLDPVRVPRLGVRIGLCVDSGCRDAGGGAGA
jgi:hypothetical protein